MSAVNLKADAVGQAVSRVDGKLKTTGTAIFSAEFQIENLAHACLVFSSIAKGKIKNIETEIAENSAGVIAVITHENAPKIIVTPSFGSGSPEPSAAASTIPYLNTDEIFYNGQPIAVVIAETLEQAEHAATLVKIEYTEEKAIVSFDAEIDNSILPDNILGEKPEFKKGDAEKALVESKYKVDNVYRTPGHNHNAIEPHATLAHWHEDGERLTVYDATQYVAGIKKMLAKKFALAEENVRVISQFVGGGFGGKGTAWAHVPLAVAASKYTKRPVKLVLSREAVHLAVGGRTPSFQHVALAANDNGKLTALIHTGVTQTTVHNNFPEQFTFPARHLYATETMWLLQKVVNLNIVPNTFMRAPGESIGTFALESAMDELAFEIGIDPIELRRINEPDKDPAKETPFSMRNMVEAYRRGAEKFGWRNRNPNPRTTRDGRWLVGCGAATAFYPAYQLPASAKVLIFADGKIIGQSAAHEMGMGTATAQAQMLADEFGVPFENVKYEYGDSILPDSPVAGGSNQTLSVSAALKAATDAVKKMIHGLIGEDEESPLYGSRFDAVEFSGGGVFLKDDTATGETFVAILARFGMDKIEADGDASPGLESFQYSMGSYGAQFCEVGVDEDTGEVRVRRFTGVFDCGRIVNPKTASSQFRGGITMGIGAALTEELLFDDRKGRIINPSLAEYHVPVHADVPQIEVDFLDIPDPQTNLGIHGVGEIGITGVAAAVANAVFNATGKRVRDLPITLDKLL